MAQWFKPWPADLAFLDSIPTAGGNLFNHTQGSIACSLSLSPYYHPDMTEILLKRTENLKSDDDSPITVVRWCCVNFLCWGVLQCGLQ